MRFYDFTNLKNLTNASSVLRGMTSFDGSVPRVLQTEPA